MNKKDLARRLAKESHRSRGQAADAVDDLVHRLLMDLKKPLQKPKASSEKAALRTAPKEPS